ncbi:MAG TPA: hypothetical protein VJ783_01575 [Pirellulales bacterium]|nr:hypothetical protein [Pirellulales bacterium]
MRALCGAIIAAGAMIGLGLTSIGIGLRFQVFGMARHEYTDQIWGAPSLMISMIVLIIGVGVGLGIAFIGLAYHHHRRHHEMLRYTTPRSEPPIAA